MVSNFIFLWNSQICYHPRISSLLEVKNRMKSIESRLQVTWQGILNLHPVPFLLSPTKLYQYTGRTRLIETRLIQKHGSFKFFI